MMRSSFDSQLRQLNNELIEMGALCEEAITLSAKALAEGSAKICLLYTSPSPRDRG